MSDEDPRRRTQKELIREAVEAGYFAVPREVSLTELSERLGMTDREAKRELNRALDEYLRENLFDDGLQ
ncbi:helix-turn-helix domain-containing protein [Halobium salinum]|uniref:Helix-turn-helix domain-containing protein n=1 Tax=Halobium salinum TaxID=1364940 RepID=A0ABD5P818_9EURY|nr:helix-turn-helix domain-containing protein [Halobium salinum]